MTVLGGTIDIVVELVVATERDDTDLREDCWSIALDQRAFGPRIHLVDWFSCDDQLLRSARLALAPDEEWWDVP